MGKRVLTMMSARVIVLNDQGGGVIDVSDKSMTLRAQEHGHQPVVCFEPGISTRIGGVDGS